MDNNNTNNTKYNLRSSSSKHDEEDLKKHEQSDSESDSDYNPNDESSDFEDSDNQELDKKEYNKFLLELFPSKYMKSKVENDACHESSAYTTTALEDDEDGETIGSQDTDSEDDDDFDELFDDDEFLESNATKFNIVFTVDASIPQGEDEYEENDDEDTDSEDNEETDNSSDSDYIPPKDCNVNKISTKTKSQTSKSENKKETAQKTNPSNSVKPKRSKKNTITQGSSNPKRSSDKNSKSTKQNNNVSPSVNKKSIEEKEKQIDDFDSMLNLLKTQQREGSKKMLDKFNKMLDSKKEELKKDKQKYEKKQQIKNTKMLKKLFLEQKQENELLFFKKMKLDEQDKIIETMKEIKKYTHVEKPYKLRLIESDIPVKYKAIAMRKLNALKYMDPGSGEYYKIKQWIDNFMMIPFGMYRSLPISIQDGNEKCFDFMQDAKNKLNGAVYGLDDAKSQIMQLMGQWISNPNSVGTAIAIKGPMGTGKTTLIKEGISKVLNRPFAFLALGGATDSAYLEGHSYTYEGSSWGQIVEILKQSKCMNPVIYFDELDKVSETAKGEEIIGILTHLTDTTQNSQYHDKYFSEIDFDLSKCLFIFSYNDERKVNPILRDRMYVIETKGYNKKEKTTIAKDYLIPSIEKNINFEEGQVTINDEMIGYISENYTNEEKGVRNLKRCLEIIYSKLNLYRLMPPKTKLFNDEETLEISFPFDINEEVVNKILKKGEKPQWLYSMYT